jgi:hypothetical protein
MEARLRLPRSLSPCPMRRTHKPGSEEPRRERSQAKERPRPRSGTPRALPWRLLNGKECSFANMSYGSTTFVPVRGDVRVGAPHALAA